MLRANNPAVAMQKVYDDCYLTCSTAIYFEKQGDEDEALRNWRSALDQIYYHNAYKVPAGYRPKTETERALQDSLRDLELQCKERVDLLDALQKSKKDSRKNFVQRVISGGSATSDTFIGSGSIPSAEYITLPRPQLQTQQSATRPKVLTQSSSQSFRDRVTPQMIEEAQREADQRAAATAAMPPPVKREGRSPSPEKKGGFFRSTLRAASGKDSRLAPSLRPGQPAAPASKAATVAWPAAHSSEMPPPSSSSQASRQQSMDIPRAEQPVASNIGKKHAYSRQPDSPNEDVRRTASMDVPVRPRSNEPTMREYGGGPRGPAVDAYVRRSQDLSRPTSNTMPPPPKPSANTNVGSSRLPASAPTSPPLPQLQYRSEYGSESLDQRNVNMLKSRQARMNLDASKSAPAASSSQGQSPSKLRQALRMVPRKAVGTGPSPQPTAPAVYAKPAGKPPAKEQIPPSSQSAPRSTGEAQQAKKMVRAKAPASAPAAVPAAIKKEPVLASTPPPEEASDDERPATTEWDKKVKYLMKHLPKGVDEQAAKSILNEIVVKGDEVHWDDIAGLDIAKNALKEAVVYPFLRPDLFMGLREPARGMLLFGPPGTGKTMLARAVATESKSTFFAISASSLTSKYLGESEKLVRALFSLAKSLTPAIIFVDEIDSLLSSRSGASEHEATRRIKTEFLIQWSDLASAAAGKQQTEGDASRVLVLAATNLPWAIDEAARRRFVRRQYIPLPEPHVRESQLRKLMTHQRHNLRDRDYKRLVVLTDGFSGSDITALAKDAAMGPLRALGERLLHMSPEDIRPISLQDFEASLVNIRPSVSKQGLKEFEDWAKEFGERGG